MQPQGSCTGQLHYPGSYIYGCELYLTPPRRKPTEKQVREGQRPQKAIVGKLASTYRQAQLMTTGGLRSTPSDTMETLLGVLPFHLLVDKHRYKAAIRLATLPDSSPLHRHVLRAARHDVRHFNTPLHALIHGFCITPHAVERIEATRKGREEVKRVHTEIARGKDDAVQRERDDRGRIKVFGDGLGYEGQVGAAAVLFVDGERCMSLRMRLGSLRHATVYNGECTAIALSMELIRKHIGCVRDVSIYVDNQAAIRAMTSWKAKPGHYLVDVCHRQLARIRRVHPATAKRGMYGSVSSSGL
ncbi:hypothetical protein ONZ45_g2013 [Pleurotus djamor]|nr:hypothetical protein ONZ45_g2013 [Pleurotus djamor]